MANATLADLLPSAGLAVTTLLCVAAGLLRPGTGEAAAVVFPPWVAADQAALRVVASAPGWKVLRLATAWPLPVVLAEPDGPAVEPTALRALAGAWLVVSARGAAGCESLPRGAER